ncbi:hypothetical protein [Vibrio coralliilyticus]|uniref:hypothetical protein n=1 Tax=Vibrio coralliilyticus TaxID=190893 RepID=UPI0020A2AEBF|nr:hypothetical protein [Vibrio coralliilyticus]
MQYKTTHYDALIQQYGERKFTKNDIKSFVHRVFSMYERATVGKERVPAEAFKDLVDEDIHVDFPDYKIRSRQEFLEWHDWIHDLLLSDDHDIRNIDVSYLANGKYQARFDIRWRGECKDGSFTDLNIEQSWIMYESDEHTHPVIEHYVAVVKDVITASEAN